MVLKIFRLNKIILVCFIVVLVNSLVAGSVISQEGASDWTMYHYNAQHTGYNDKDSISVPLQLLWKKNYFTQQHWIEPLTAVGDRIIMTNDRSAQNPIVNTNIFSISSIDGSVLWRHEYNGHNLSNFSQTTYYDGNVYLIESHDDNDSVRIGEYDLLTGTLLTRFYYGAQNFDQLGLIVYDNKLIFPAGFYNGVMAIDLETSSFIWWNDLPQIDLWAPVAFDTVVYSWNKNLLSAHNLFTGEYLWFMAPYYYDTAIIPINSANSNSKELILTNSLTEETFFGPPFSTSGMNTAAVLDTTINMIFSFYHNGFYAVNFDTKRRIWKKDLDYSVNIILSTPSICDGKVYNIFLDTLIAMDALTGEEQWRYTLDTLTAYSTAIANGLIFVSTQNKTIALDLDTQVKVWEYPAGGFLTIANNKLFIASITGDVYTFGRVSTDIDDNVTNELPTGFELNQNYPNPFNPSTEISFTIPEKSKLRITIYNILGEEVRLLADKQYSAGSHTILWDGTDNKGRNLVSGMYVYKLETEQYKSSKKMILLK